jgi:hypothetical protein
MVCVLVYVEEFEVVQSIGEGKAAVREVCVTRSPDQMGIAKNDIQMNDSHQGLFRVPIDVIWLYDPETCLRVWLITHSRIPMDQSAWILDTFVFE